MENKIKHNTYYSRGNGSWISDKQEEEIEKTSQEEDSFVSSKATVV